MAGKSAVQKLIEQYEASIVEHQRAIESAKQFIDALRATQKAKARVKPRKPATVTASEGGTVELTQYGR